MLLVRMLMAESAPSVPMVEVSTETAQQEKPAQGPGEQREGGGWNGRKDHPSEWDEL